MSSGRDGRGAGPDAPPEERLLFPRTWDERLRPARAAGPAARRTADPAIPLAEWQTAVDPQDLGQFGKRLEWDGLTGDDAMRLLAGDGLYPVDTPDWAADLRGMQQACRTADDPCADVAEELPELPFVHVLRPLVDWQWQRACQESPILVDVSEPARTGIRHALLARLAEVCTPAFAHDFLADRPTGKTILLRLDTTPSAQHPTDNYRAWCRAALADGLSRLLGEYPVLARLICLVGRQWRECTAEMVQRVTADRRLIADRFGIGASTPWTAVRWGLSDPHRGGRSVAILGFGDDPDCAIVYKPKDMRLEERFHDVVAEVSGWAAEDGWRSLTVAAAGDDYGYAQRAVWRPCSGSAELESFYRNAGRLLCLLHLLGATDAHLENLISEGPSPFLIDAETLFQGRQARDDADAGEQTEARPLEDSVLRVGMLPSWLVAGEPPQAFDITALGARSMTSPRTYPGWRNVNTDDLVWAPVERTPEQPASLPVPAGTPNPLAEHADDIAAGFTEVYRLTMQSEHRRRLRELLAGFQGLRRRVVLRATRVYAKLQTDGLQPEALSSPTRRGLVLEKLARTALLSPSRDPQWQVFHAEVRDMENLDVPYFEYELGGDVVQSTSGPLPGLLAGNGLGEALQRIAALSDTDLDWQVRIIRGTITARHQLVNRAQAQPEALPAHVPPERLAAAVEELRAGLLRAAVDDGRGGRTWLCFTAITGLDRLNLGLVGNSLYDGRVGLAAFLLMCAQADGDPRRMTEGLSVLEPALRTLRSQDASVRYRSFRDGGPGWSGLGGILRLLGMPWDLMPQAGPSVESPEHQARSLLELLPIGLLHADNRLDLMGGVAGLAAPVARLHAASPTDRTEAVLRAIGHRLLETQDTAGGWPTRMADRPLTGFSHGASGMGLALLEAGCAVGDEELVQAGARAFDYEAGVFDPAVGNWPDFRQAPDSPAGEARFMVAWCHGAPGIGLARLRALQLLPGHPDAARWRAEAETAMTTTASAASAGLDHLCCGLLGRSAVLRIAGRWAQRRDWLEAADRITQGVVARAEAHGAYLLLTSTSPRTQPDAPGFMTGTAGVGAHVRTCLDGTDLSGLLL